MILNKIFVLFFIGCLMFAFSNDEINVNLKNIKIDDLIKITAKVTNKNILVLDDINGEVDFISNNQVTKNNLFDILHYVLESKGYTIVENNNIYRIVKIKDIVKNNVQMEVISLQNIEVKSIMDILTESINKRYYKNTDEKPMISGDDEANSIIVIGENEDLVYIKELISKLDIDKQQVFVQARIIEVNERKTNEMGVKYGIEGLKTGSSNALTFASNFGGKSIVLSGEVLNKVISMPNVVDGIMLGASINLLNDNGALDVVSEPSILCINNKESYIYVGETRSIKIASTTSTSGMVSDTYKREDIGLKLKVKPRISSGNKVTLEIETILEDIKNEKGANGQADTTKKEVKTLAIVGNGESVILGGLIKNKNEAIKSKVPFLGDIPIIGALFRNNFDTEDKINLVIVLTPYIVSKSENLASIRNQLTKLKAIEDKYTEEVALKLQQKLQ